MMQRTSHMYNDNFSHLLNPGFQYIKSLFNLLISICTDTEKLLLLIFVNHDQNLQANSKDDLVIFTVVLSYRKKLTVLGLFTVLVFYLKVKVGGILLWTNTKGKWKTPTYISEARRSSKVLQKKTTLMNKATRTSLHPLNHITWEFFLWWSPAIVVGVVNAVQV